MSAMFSVMFQHVTATSTILPEYFDAYGRSEPLGPAHVPTTYLAGHPEEGHFALLKKDETAMNTFNLAMRMTSKRVPVTGVYDMTSVLDAAAAGRETVWVDVGGGDGHTVREFLLKYPGLKSEQCVVQDLEEVVTAARQQDEAELRGVRWVGLDFLHDAPIKGKQTSFTPIQPLNPPFSPIHMTNYFPLNPQVPWFTTSATSCATTRTPSPPPSSLTWRAD